MGQNNRLQSYISISEGVIFSRATFTLCCGGSTQISNSAPMSAGPNWRWSSRQQRGQDPAPTSYISLGPHPRARIDVLALVSTIQGSGRRPEVGVGADAVMWRRGTTDRCRRPSEVDDDAHPQEGATTIADRRNRGGKKTSLLLYPDGPAALPAGFLLVEPNVFKESKPSYLRTGPPCSL